MLVATTGRGYFPDMRSSIVAANLIMLNIEYNPHNAGKNLRQYNISFTLFLTI